MTKTPWLEHLPVILLAVVTVVYGAHFMTAADPMPVEAGAVATPNHNPHHVSLIPSAAAPAPADALAAWSPEMLRAEPEEAVALPAPSFVAADTLLYAKANARLRAAPSTGADVMARLAANAPLRAVAHSSDGAWWQVSLADSQTAYVHRDAVTTFQLVKLKPPAEPAPTATPVATASPPAWPPRRAQDLVGFVDQAKNWFSDVANNGSAPKMMRPER